ncbi:putative protein kinase RLK-Pelle-CrRLK1L-1 family [Helianthus annuus]|nr:putative protein kinase RLK-Pelle-CrRLK1L-1 family [Helianthus annuus]
MYPGELLSSAKLCVRFTLQEIQSATNNFNDALLIGHGGFGKVYKGCLYTNGTRSAVAVKRLDSKSNQGASEFRAEIEMLSKLRHRHLVSLIGFCDDNQEMILIYEYMPHGTVCGHLHKARTPLTWAQRLKIAIGAARGLDYLHTGTPHGVIHRDVKTSNILLDENWEAMISDFGLLPVDTRYGEEQCSLLRWAKKCVKESKLDQIVDCNLKGTIFLKCLKRFVEIVDRCVHSFPKERPTMTEVVASLQYLVELLEQSKSNTSAIKGLTWKMRNYFVSTTKPNSGIHLFISVCICTVVCL